LKTGLHGWYAQFYPFLTFNETTGARLNRKIGLGSLHIRACVKV
jgi:hypothetical protein